MKNINTPKELVDSIEMTLLIGSDISNDDIWEFQKIMNSFCDDFKISVVLYMLEIPLIDNKTSAKLLFPYKRNMDYLCKKNEPRLIPIYEAMKPIRRKQNLEILVG